MQKRTAAKVADLLGLAEVWLDSGRPRKRPMKSRPEAEMYSLPCKVTRANFRFFYTEKVSLVGAFKAARLEQGYSRRVQKLAELQLAHRTWPMTYEMLGLQGIDDIEFDTRALIRDIRAARKNVERTYLAESA